jgi:hypothetical protein
MDNSINTIGDKNRINAMFINQNHTLLSLATNEGYKIYESNNFIKVSEDSDIDELIGSLKIAIPFYESNLMIIVGSDSNINFPSNQLLIWNDINKKKLGVIMFKEKILDVKVSKEAFYIMLDHKIIAFSSKECKYLLSINDVSIYSNFYISYNINPVVLLHSCNSKPHQLKVTKCIMY